MATAKRTSLETFWPWPEGTLTFDAMSIDASGEKVAQVFVAEETDTITHLGFRYGVRTGTPPVYRISLQSLDTSGNPDGTILGGGSPASATFTPPADTTWNSTWQWIDLDNDIAVTRGTMYAIVVDYSSGTINASNFSSFNQSVTAELFGRWGIGYSLTHNGTSWAKTNAKGLEGYKSASSVYGYPVTTFAVSTLATNGHRGACKITIPTNFCTTFKVRGIRLNIDSESAGGSNKFGIWNAAGTALQTVTFDSDWHANPANTKRSLMIIFSGTLATLDAGTAYYYGIERVGSACGLNCFNFSASGDMVAMPFQGDALLSTWTGAAWGDTNTSLPPCGLMLDDLTAPSGGGGAVYHGAMAGGLLS